MSFSALLLRSLVAELSRRGVPTESLFRNSGVDPSLLEESAFTLSSIHQFTSQTCRHGFFTATARIFH